MKKHFFFLLFLATSISFGQSVNDYKYVIVPVKFTFLKKSDQYRINTATKSMLEKYGFVAFFDNENLPPEVSDYNCNKLYADVESNGSFIATKLRILLKDCKGNTVFATEEGKSWEKEYQVAYNQALREAAKSFDDLGYKYNGTVTAVEKTTVRTVNDGSTVKKETIVAPLESKAIPGKETFFAQPIANGFQLVDSTPKVVMKIYNTNTKDMFIAEKDQLKGVLRNDNGNWIFEYYTDGKLNSEGLNIKF